MSNSGQKKDGLAFPFYPNLAMDIDWKKTISLLFSLS